MTILNAASRADNVETRMGYVRGAMSGCTLSYKGIPYASAPLGSRRFQPCEPVRPWAGVRDATQFGPASLQPATAWGGRPEHQDENCLNLNIWTPGRRGAARPVLVWIHGGAFEMGSSSLRSYDGAKLAARGDMVVVTFNYRLGALGFVDLRAFAGNGFNPASNLGLRDQLAALQWVRDNIASFGGDPNRITLGGDSAGAISVICLMCSPRARALFQRAIVQSGSASHVTTESDAERVAHALLSSLEIAPKDAARLQELPARSLIAAQRACKRVALNVDDGQERLRLFAFPFVPTIGDDVLPCAPLRALGSELASPVPLLVGTNREEWASFVYLSGDTRKQALDERTLRRCVEARLPGYADSVISDYRAAMRAQGGVPTATDLFIAIETDRFFRIPALRTLDARWNGARALSFSYLFSWRSPMLGGVLRACHGLEVPFVFGAVGTRPARVFAGVGPEAEMLRDAIMTAWASFVHGDPPTAAGLPMWAQYEPSQRATMLLGADCALIHNPLSERTRAWDRMS
jgi:para-nitrobenzyl esterase